MATTAHFGWAKPVLTDAPNGPAQIGALADAVDTALYNAAIGNTGHRTSGLTITTATGWTGLVYSYSIINGLFDISIDVNRSAGQATLTASSTGAITHTLVATLPASAQPAAVKRVTWQSDTAAGLLTIDPTSGNIVLQTAYPTSSIAAGDSLHFSAMYAL